jgi:hypothetical protein
MGMRNDMTGLALACRREEQDAVLIANFRESVHHGVPNAS